MAFNPFQWTISSFISESVHNIKETPSCRRSPFLSFSYFSFLPLLPPFPLSFPLSLPLSFPPSFPPSPPARIRNWFESCSLNPLLIVLFSPLSLSSLPFPASNLLASPSPLSLGSSLPRPGGGGKLGFQASQRPRVWKQGLSGLPQPLLLSC